MRRPHRTIEVFDISLMAVVTKAMGAFLVLMVVFMPYYSSGPLGQQTAAGIEQSMTESQQDLTDAMKKLVEHKDPDEIAKLLEQVRRKLEWARQQIAQLRRANDQLNAQAERYRAENEQLRKKAEQLEQALKSDTHFLGGTLVNWDCLDVTFDFGALTVDTTWGGDKNIRHGFNGGTTIGVSDSNDDTSLNAASRATAPGEGSHFNNALFFTAVYPKTRYMIVVAKKRLGQGEKIGPFQSAKPLSRSKQDCTVYLTLQRTTVTYDEKRKEIAPKSTYADISRKFVIPKDLYAALLFDMEVNEQGGLSIKAVTDQENNWLADQIAHAVKLP
jgi:hypothetical protein